MRKIIITGRVVSDAQVKLTTTGRQLLEFRFANNERTDKEGQTFWGRARSFNQQHIKLAQYLTKGKPIIMDGHYEDSIYLKKDGTSEIDHNILLDSVSFIDSPKPQQAQPQNSEAQIPQATYNGGVTPNTTPTPTPTVEPQKVEAPKPKKVEAPTPTPQPLLDNEDDDLPF